MEKEVFFKQSAKAGERGINPVVPFKRGDVVAYLSKTGKVQNIILLDCVMPRSDKEFDIYYDAMMNVSPRQFDTHGGRMWHVGHGMREATIEEVRMLLREMWKQRC